ncbi:MAG: proteasome subunit beta, partial [archaeon]
MEEEFKKKTAQTGTTTMGLVCKDGLVLAADKRVTMGGMFIAHKSFDKAYMLTDNIVITMAGSVSEAQMILKLTKAELELKKLRTKKETTVKEAANLYASITYQNIRR